MARGDIVLIQDRTALSGRVPKTGEELFRYEASVHTIASVTTQGNRIFLPANGMHVLEYNPATRKVELVWFEQRLRGGNSSPVVFGDRVFRGAESVDLHMCGRSRRKETLGRAYERSRLGNAAGNGRVRLRGGLRR